MESIDHLALAKEDLEIAESADAKREAYKRAAEHIAAYKDETGASNRQIGSELQLERSGRATEHGPTKYVEQLLKWRKQGYPSDTPWMLDDQATTRAARSHAKKLIATEPQTIAKQITEAPPEQRKQIIEALAEDEVTEGEVTEASVQATSKRLVAEREGRTVPPKLRRQGALAAHGAIVSRASSAEHQAKLAIEEWKSADEPIPPDLAESALECADGAVGAWELVRAMIKGESVGDEAEAFLADHE